MSKKILILTGSPRRGGNSDLLAEAFIKGAQAQGHETTKFETAFELVAGCKACDACWSKGQACVFPDGFEKLAPLLEKAETLVLVTPLYWFGFSAQLKAAFDKLYAYTSPNCKIKLKITESALLVCGEDSEPEHFSGAVETYKNILGYLNWADKGILIVPNVLARGEITATKALEQAEQLGRTI